MMMLGDAHRSPNRFLRGDYHFNQMNQCVSTRDGEQPPTFDQDSLELVGPARIVSFQSEGVTNFDGTGRVKVRGPCDGDFP